jgi:cyclic beta-1,2-glucan synthetase
MLALSPRLFRPWPSSSPWDGAPVREDLFGAERLEQHAETLAAAQAITDRPRRVAPLQKRLADNANVLLAAYRASAAELAQGRGVVPAAEWLLDNYHLVEAQIREIRTDLPPGYYRQLPKLAAGPFAGYPRVFGIAWAFVAHTDSHFDPDMLRRFIVAYQRVQPLTIGEVWAIAITLRIVLVENLRRLADQMTAGRSQRADADALTGRILSSAGGMTQGFDVALRQDGPLSEIFAAQLAKGLRDQDPRTTPALDLLSERLSGQGTSIDNVVSHAQQRQGASNVTVRNIITSMRLISDIDWADLFESVSLVDARMREGSAFGSMDFPTRNLYRSAIEDLARGSDHAELAIAERVLAEARHVKEAAPGPAEAGREGDPGYYLIAEGRLQLERAIRFRPGIGLRIARFNVRLGMAGYIGWILVLTLALLAAGLWSLGGLQASLVLLALWALAAFVPATEVATALVNRGLTRSFGPLTLPALEFAAGVPAAARTLVAVPTLLTTSADLLEQIERLEVHHLSGAGGELSFVLVTDGVDSDQEILEGDEALVELAAESIRQLNVRHGQGPAGDRFFLLHRRRVFNASENRWMGWERKRGKLHELNRMLRGDRNTTFRTPANPLPSDVRYVVTLDADTRLPRDAVARLIGKMAHPLNRPRFDPECQRVCGGYGILQPRVTPSLPVGREGSLYQRVFSGPGGMDPYAAAVSDVYQDLFGEGSYTGKGIYDIDAFEAAMAGRVPDNTLLSHDLFEGVFARAGLASDVEVVEDFPSRYDVAARRQHRWTRGDWQLLPWILGDWGPKALSQVGRGKMLDNFRRSLLAPATLAMLLVGWLLPWPANVAATLLAVATIAAPAFLPSLFALLPARAGSRLRNHVAALSSDLRLAAAQTFLTLALLPDQARRMVDAIARTGFRLLVSRRNLLEWTTAARSKAEPQLDWLGFSRAMAWGTAASVLASLAVLLAAPASWPLVLPFVLLWLAAPAIALFASRPPRTRQIAASDPDAAELRLVARRTWRFFETFVTADDNMLPPDNFQEIPAPVLAHRTSPTNIGLYLLSTVAAHDFGWAGTLDTLERLEATVETMRKMSRFRGHFFNWYGTRDLVALPPVYVSSVDSGNLAGHLIALANACEEWRGITGAPDPRPGLIDALVLARRSLALGPAPSTPPALAAAAQLTEAGDLLRGPLPVESLSPALLRLFGKALRSVRQSSPVSSGADIADVEFWIGALERRVQAHGRDVAALAEDEPPFAGRLRLLASAAREMALAMEFGFLLEQDRKLLAIGYSVADSGQDPSCYDLLASEARLASLFAIAKGDVPSRHWFRLGRAATPLGSGSALISWSGSMFEYLMPSLVMRAPSGSLLDETNRLVVERQVAYGKARRTPWGISESAYNASDFEFTYQYSNFGVPGLGLKRGLADDLVIAPYATGLAAMVDVQAARLNFDALAGIGALGPFGFYEAIDFTPTRLPDGKTHAVVRAYMAHHQGMTIVSIANAMQDGRMRSRFHREPMIQACELLLQERMPRDVDATHPRAEEVKASQAAARTDAPSLRRWAGPQDGPPSTHLLSNGRYAVMLTSSAGGYSRWRDVAVTRWREDATLDDWGSFIVLRDTRSGETWSPGRGVANAPDASDSGIFGEDRAEFSHRSGSLATTMDVLVSGEDDGEVRRVSVTNSGRRPREIDVTSYAELVLTSAASDIAHPAFAKMFVQTEHLPEFGALVATRRPRSPHEAPIWAAHFAVVEGDMVAEPQFETDRARFIGRGRTLATAACFATGDPLSNTVGTVLDPVFALRRRVRVPAGKVVRIAFWTVVAASREDLLVLVDKHSDRNAFERARTLAWTQAQVQLRHLGVDADEAADFQRMASPILYADSRFRPSSDAIARGAGPQSDLWSSAISGDLPIVVMRIDGIENMAQVRQILRAHEYWRMKQLAVDLVIVNERASSYTQDLQIAIETAVRSSQSRPRLGDEATKGTVFVLRADLIGQQTRSLLQSAGRVVLSARHGCLSEQRGRLPAPAPVTRLIPALAPRKPPSGPASQPRLDLEFFNGIGGFDRDGSEYVTILRDGATTPAPWINVVANPGFGFQASADGSGYTWADNSRENQVTAWSNDPVIDPAGEAIYVRDDATGVLITATAQPIRDAGVYVARHGFGTCRFEHEANDLSLALLQFVPLADPVKISRLTIRNLSDRPRRLSVTAYAEWVLGTSRGACGPFVATRVDPQTGAMFATNPWSLAFAERVAFSDLAGTQSSWTGDRTDFIGRGGSMASPAGLTGKGALSRATGSGLDPCSALQRMIVVGPGETTEIVWFLGQCATAEAARDLVLRFRQADLDAVLAEVTAWWARTLGAVQVRTPNRAMDIMLNGWLLYQTIACRVMARSAFYQSSGAYGFRDQLQDGMALSFALPDETRRHLLRAAARQFVEGDVQHWWLPHSGQGVRSRISDDRVWLAFATATYVATSGDEAVLDELAPFLEGPALRPEEHESFFPTMVADEGGTLFEHCARGIDQSVAMTGELGLPLIGTGDWNDGMNRVGEGGRGESVWLGWLLVRTIALFAPLAGARDPGRAARWTAHASAVSAALERNAWDGEWYRRATFDDGSWLGSHDSAECQIDSIAQSWAVLSGAADPERAAVAMKSLERGLLRWDAGLALLFTPPFESAPHDPGYIKGYPAGLRENGGQYSHAAMWAIMAFARLGEADKAVRLFDLLNPIHHARTPEEARRYKVEPYVVAADVYAVAPHAGRGGWTWYTGAAGWMARAGFESILGIRREAGELVVQPRIPTSWPGFEATVTLGETVIEIQVVSSDTEPVGAWRIVLDGTSTATQDGTARVRLDGRRHALTMDRGIDGQVQPNGGHGNGPVGT